MMAGNISNTPLYAPDNHETNKKIADMFKINSNLHASAEYDFCKHCGKRKRGIMDIVFSARQMALMPSARINKVNKQQQQHQHFFPFYSLFFLSIRLFSSKYLRIAREYLS